MVPGAGRAASFSFLCSAADSGPGLLMPPLSLMLGIKGQLVAVLTGRPCPWNASNKWELEVWVGKILFIVLVQT